MIRHPPIPPLFPYTTLFRSAPLRHPSIAKEPLRRRTKPPSFLAGPEESHTEMTPARWRSSPAPHRTIGLARITCPCCGVSAPADSKPSSQNIRFVPPPHSGMELALTQNRLTTSVGGPSRLNVEQLERALAGDAQSSQLHFLVSERGSNASPVFSVV